MPDEVPPAREPDYRAARIGAGIALTFALIGLLFLDAISAEYELQPVTLGFLLTAIGAMFSVDIGKGIVSLLRGK